MDLDPQLTSIECSVEDDLRDPKCDPARLRMTGVRAHDAIERIMQLSNRGQDLTVSERTRIQKLTHRILTAIYATEPELPELPQEAL